VRDLKGWDKLLSTIKAWLSKVANAIGVKITWTDDMVRDFVAGMTREELRNGTAINRTGDAALAHTSLVHCAEPWHRRWRNQENSGQ